MSREWNRLTDTHRKLIEEHQRNLPVRLSSLAAALGLSVRAATLQAGIAGELRPDLVSGYTIRVSRHDNTRRQRYTVAHEIAHFLLHRELIGSGIRDDVLNRSNLSDAVEAEANRLAADILMPRDVVDRAVSSARTLGAQNVVSLLANQFQVSEDAMRIRLEGMGHAT